jgi:excisionase family DNA binding protein
MEMEILISPEEAAKVLGISVGTLAVWRSTGRYPLAYIKVGGLVRYRPDDISTFITSRVMNSPESPEPTNLRSKR